MSSFSDYCCNILLVEIGGTLGFTPVIDVVAVGRWIA
jgi:hypothetical protein